MVTRTRESSDAPLGRCVACSDSTLKFLRWGKAKRSSPKKVQIIEAIHLLVGEPLLTGSKPKSVGRALVKTLGWALGTKRGYRLFSRVPTTKAGEDFGGTDAKQ